MSRKVILPVLSVLLTSVMLLASCGPRAAPAPEAPTPAAPAPATPTPATPTPATPTPAASTEKPKYGGTINLMTPTDLVGPMVYNVSPVGPELLGFVYEQMTNVNWSKGPAGTGETSFGEFGAPGIGSSFQLKFEDVHGSLAESFEIPAIDTWIFNIRQGVHYALDPGSEVSRLVNGREMTADDIVSVFELLKIPPNQTYSGQNAMTLGLIIEKTGPWQVTVKTPVNPGASYHWLFGGGSGHAHWPPEAYEQFWSKGKNSWRDAIGTGPYMLTDFIPGSVATFARNPNYWGKNPVGPGKGDQLPYPDVFKVLIVPDTSTRMAAIRTHKADWTSDVEAEEAQGLLKSDPQLQYKKFIQSVRTVGMRTDKAELPFKDVRVRQALHMAIDRESIKNDLYGGEAEIMTWPFAPLKGAEHLYVPLEQMPESVQALFKYDPARAKQLLAEAGYPNGFKTTIMVRNNASEVDTASLYKAMWAKIGVDLEIQPRELGVYNSINVNRAYDGMILYSTQTLTGFANRYSFGMLRGPGSSGNKSFVNEPAGTDPVIENAFQEMQKYVHIDYPGADLIFKSIVPHILEQAYYVMSPSPYNYRVWQPWLKNYYGEAAYKFWIQYAWIDQDLKEKMTGRR